MYLSQLIHVLERTQRTVAPESPKVKFHLSDKQEFDITDNVEIGLTQNKKEVAILLFPAKPEKFNKPIKER